MSDGTADRQLRERARAVIPGGMYGHQAAPGAAYPQFMRGGRGARVWDVDGNRFLDFAAGIAAGRGNHHAVDVGLRQAERRPHQPHLVRHGVPQLEQGAHQARGGTFLAVPSSVAHRVSCSSASER